jgi:hypothetical protein
MALPSNQYPKDFTGFLSFLCQKYNVDPSLVFVSYDSNPPPSLRGPRLGYYDGLLSYRERNGNVEFLITVFKIARDPLLTLGHEFAHLVEDLERGKIGGNLGPPDELREKKFDAQSKRDLAEFKKMGHLS